MYKVSNYLRITQQSNALQEEGVLNADLAASILQTLFYFSLCVPSLLYGCEVWSLTKTDIRTQEWRMAKIISSMQCLIGCSGANVTWDFEWGGRRGGGGGGFTNHHDKRAIDT